MSGRVLVVVGLALAAVGGLMLLGLPLGRLPGDIVLQRGRGTIYVPVATSLLLSVLLTVVLWVLRR